MKWKTKKITYSRTSEDVCVVKIGKDFDDELGGKILESWLHVLSRNFGPRGCNTKGDAVGYHQWLTGGGKWRGRQHKHKYK